MKRLYTISPFVRTDSIPEYSSIARIVLDNFYLFKVYSTNPYIVKVYMDFIDNNFDFAFSKLKLDMIYYEYPDWLNNDFAIINYINETYNLSTEFELRIQYRLVKSSNIDYLTGKEIQIYTNEYVQSYVDISGYNLLDDYMLDTFAHLIIEINYFTNRETSIIIKELIDKLVEYYKKLDYISNGSIEITETGIISPDIFILYNLKDYIRKISEERREENGNVHY